MKADQKESTDFFEIGQPEQPKPTKPAEVNIQSLYSQSGQNQFFTQMPGTLNFGTNIQQQYQTAGLNQNSFEGINFNSLSQQPEPQPTQLNFGTNNFGTNNFGNSVPVVQSNLSEIKFATNNVNNPSSFNTNTLGLNSLFATNLNLGPSISMNTGANIPSIPVVTQNNTSSNFFDAPTQQSQQSITDPFSALESMAIQSNFHTTSNNTTVQSPNTNMFFTQSNSVQNNNNSASIDLL